MLTMRPGELQPVRAELTHTGVKLRHLHEYLFLNNVLPSFKRLSTFWCRHTTAGLMDLLIKLEHRQVRNPNPNGAIEEGDVGMVPRSDEEYEVWLEREFEGGADLEFKLDKESILASQRWMAGERVWHGVSGVKMTQGDIGLGGIWGGGGVLIFAYVVAFCI